MRDVKTGALAGFDYEGQEEMDYTIWADDAVIVFEAKQFSNNNGSGLDIGWHKLVFPCARFRDYDGLKIVPVYYLRRGYVIYLFVFPKVKFHEDGIILNDSDKFTPSVIYRLNLASLQGLDVL